MSDLENTASEKLDWHAPQLTKIGSGKETYGAGTGQDESFISGLAS